MDKRLFFTLGDLLANTAIGLIVGLASWAIVGPAWNMWLAMFAMMALGMVCGLIFFFPVGLKLGAMEVMVPLMFSGMLSGMVVGMWEPMSPLSAGSAALIGALSGFVGITCIWAVNARLRGVAEQGERT